MSRIPDPALMANILNYHLSTQRRTKGRLLLPSSYRPCQTEDSILCNTTAWHLVSASYICAAMQLHDSLAWHPQNVAPNPCVAPGIPLQKQCTIGGPTGYIMHTTCCTCTMQPTLCSNCSLWGPMCSGTRSKASSCHHVPGKGGSDARRHRNSYRSPACRQ